MQPNPLLGVVFHWLGGLASGSFYVPYKGVRKWSWETFWLAGGMFSWLICPWIGAFLLSKDLLAVLHETSAYTFWMTYLMGVLWGLGGLTFGLTMRYLGMSLGMAVALGYCAAFGTLVPPIVKGEFAAKLLQTHGGNICFLGVIVCLVGIAIGGFAGVRKERDMGNDGKSSAITEFSLWKGLAIATFSGVMSSCFSYGFQFGDPITKISASHGTGPYWVGLPVIVVILLGGLTTNFIWCVLLNFKNRTGYQYFASHVREEHAHHGGLGSSEHAPAQSSAAATPTDLKIPVLGNWIFCVVAGTLWYFQFFFYQMGESQMGNYKFSSWTLHMASIIIFSTLWGIFFKEWRGARALTKLLVVIMLLFLIGSTVIIGWETRSPEKMMPGRLRHRLPKPSRNKMLRHAFKMKLKPGMAAEYKKRHDEIWPQLATELQAAGISDYSIFLDEETLALFAVHKLSHNNAEIQLANSPMVRKWWDFMAPLMEVHPDNSPVAKPLREVFHLE